MCARRPVGARIARTVLGALGVLLALACTAARAGTLTKADVESLFPPPLLVGEKLAHLPVWPVFVRGERGPVLQNHVFETVDLEPVAGYGGKPLNLLVVMDRDGVFVQTRLLAHTEPIFRSPAGDALLGAFAAQYQGVSVQHQVQVLGAKAQRVVTPTTATLHGIVAGTVTATAIDRSIMEAAAQVAQAHARGASAPLRGESTSDADGPDDRYQRTGFNGLAALGLVQPWAIEQRTLDARFRDRGGERLDAEGSLRPESAAVDLWLALVGLPQAGRNLLDGPRWRAVRALREQGSPVLLTLDGGRYGLHAPGASPTRRFGAQLTLRQDGRDFALEELPWQQGLRLSGQHSGVALAATPRYWRVRPLSAGGPALDVLRPVELTLDVWRRGGDDQPLGVRFERRFEIPNAAAHAPARETPRWMEPWRARRADLAGLAAGLAALAVLLVRQRWLAATARRLRRWRLAILVLVLVGVGWVGQGQLTVVTLTSAVEALVDGRSLGFLLADPVAVLLWGVTLVTLLVWGRGTFCGWLCPFGALQEIVARVARAAGFAQRRLRLATDRVLKRIKYAVLALLLGSAAVAPAASERLVEVEPFKTAISLHFVREGPYVAWALACVALGVFVYRGYCRYLCPLGAALALGGRLRRWAWIPRRAACGTPCQTCRHRCDYQAIDAAGRIDYAECFQCLDCVQTHDDPTHCLPLVLERKGRTIPIVAARSPR